MAHYEVIRPLRAAGADRKRGDLIDDAGMRERNVRLLVERRFLRPVTATDPAPGGPSPRAMPRRRPTEPDDE